MARAHTGDDGGTARVVVAVAEELPSAPPPEVVGRDDEGDVPARRLDQEPCAEPLHRVEVDDVGSEAPQRLAEGARGPRIVEVAPATPVDGVVGHEPRDRDARHRVVLRAGLGGTCISQCRVQLAVEGLAIGASGPDPPGEHVHVVAAARELEGAQRRDQRSAAHEVGREVGRDDEEPHRANLRPVRSAARASRVRHEAARGPPPGPGSPVPPPPWSGAPGGTAPTAARSAARHGAAQYSCNGWATRSHRNRWATSRTLARSGGAVAIRLIPSASASTSPGGTATPTPSASTSPLRTSPAVMTVGSPAHR